MEINNCLPFSLDRIRRTSLVSVSSIHVLPREQARDPCLKRAIMGETLSNTNIDGVAVKFTKFILVDSSEYDEFICVLYKTFQGPV